MKPEKDVIYAYDMFGDTTLDFGDEREDLHFFRLDIHDPEYPEGIIFLSTYTRVLQAEYHTNRNAIVGCGSVSMSDVYTFFGIPVDEYSEEHILYIPEGYCWIDFDNSRREKLANGSTCNIIQVTNEPISVQEFNLLYT